MSIDSWGGGSDQDPKLRLKEQAAFNRRFERAARSARFRAYFSGVTWRSLAVWGVIMASAAGIGIYLKPGHSEHNQLVFPIPLRW